MYSLWKDLTCRLDAVSSFALNHWDFSIRLLTFAECKHFPRLPRGRGFEYMLQPSWNVTVKWQHGLAGACGKHPPSAGKNDSQICAWYLIEMTAQVVHSKSELWSMWSCVVLPTNKYLCFGDLRCEHS